MCNMLNMFPWDHAQNRQHCIIFPHKLFVYEQIMHNFKHKYLWTPTSKNTLQLHVPGYHSKNFEKKKKKYGYIPLVN